MKNQKIALKETDRRGNVKAMLRNTVTAVLVILIKHFELRLMPVLPDGAGLSDKGLGHQMGVEKRRDNGVLV